MTTVKMRYGIDLGTTNSAICCMENGTPVIKKSDTLKDTLPSCVAFTRKQVIKVGDSAYNDNRSEKARATKKWDQGKLNVFMEFKRTMGLSTGYYSSNMNREYNSEELSAEVLKTLKSFVSGENVTAAVITIPAKFKSDQIAATKRAAALAGITHCELLQEPVAAALAYGLNSQEKDGRWLVFDFGGGTFDAALLTAEDGILRVLDTEGDNYLGGKNLDYAIVDQLLIPYLQKEYSIEEILADDTRREILRDALKFYAEQAKNQLSFKEECDITSQLDEFGEDDEGEALELDLVITRDQIRPAVEPFFRKAAGICQRLLERNSLTGDGLSSLILVGGPTRSTILREILSAEITDRINTSIDPMTAVAAGAALAASSMDTEIDATAAAGADSGSEQPLAALKVQYESNSVETEEFVSVKLLASQSRGLDGDSITLELTRSDGAWSSGRVSIDTTGDVIECSLMEGKPNSFRISATDSAGRPLRCLPDEITILQGTKVGSTVLPYGIGIEATDTARGKDVYLPLQGLEKNRTLPAVGVKNGLKTPRDLNPDVASDRLVVPVYQGEYDAEGTRACYNDHVFDVLITGQDISARIPAGSDLDITVRVDRSQNMILEVMFPVTGETVEKPIEVANRKGAELTDIDRLLDEAETMAADLEKTTASGETELIQARNLLQDVRSRYDAEKGSEDGKMHLLADVRRALLELDRADSAHNVEKLEMQIRETLELIVNANQVLGYRNEEQVEKAQRIADSALEKREPGYMQEALKALTDIHISMTLIYQMMGLARHYLEDRRSIPWKDPAAAAAEIRTLEEAVREPSVSALGPHLKRLIELEDRPENEKPQIG